MKQTMVLILLTLFLSSSASAQEQQQTVEQRRVKFDPNRDAEKDVADGLKRAKETGKHVMLDVGGEWCSWCHRMDAFFLENRDISDLLEKEYVVVKVNYSKENKNEKVLSRYPQIKGYPHLFVLDANGTLLHSQDTGLLEEGKGYSKEKMKEFILKWMPKEEKPKS